MIVSTDKKVDPSEELSLGLDDLLDVQLRINAIIECKVNYLIEIAVRKEIRETHGNRRERLVFPEEL